MGSLKFSDAFNELDYVLNLFADDILLLERIVDKVDYHRSATNCVRDWCSKNDVIYYYYY